MKNDNPQNEIKERNKKEIISSSSVMSPNFRKHINSKEKSSSKIKKQRSNKHNCYPSKEVDINYNSPNSSRNSNILNLQFPTISKRLFK